MVSIDFQITNSVIDEYRNADVTELDSNLLLYNGFEMPVRFAVEEVELLEWPFNWQPIWTQTDDGLVQVRKEIEPTPWLELPLLNLATVGLSAVRKLEHIRSTSYVLDETDERLRFEKEKDFAIVHSTYNERTGRTTYAELRQEFESFACRVRYDLGQQVPVLKDHPWWGEWFRQTGPAGQGYSFNW